MSIIQRIARWWREITKPGHGSHRAGAPTGPRVAPPRPAPLQRHRVPRPRSPYGLDKPLDGDAQRMVRPYVEREQWQRRRILYAAVALGIDLDQRMIHAAGVIR